MPYGKTPSGTIARMAACTPSDDTDNAIFSSYKYANAIWVGVAGNVVMQCVEGAAGVDYTIKAVTAGSWHTFPPFKRIKATNTTATDILVGLVSGE